MEKTITFNIPEGYIVDKKKSTDNNIVLKLDVPKLAKSERVKTWEEYCKKMDGKESYYCNFTSIKIGSSHFGLEPIVTEFDNLKDAEAFVALSKLLKLRKDWIGEWKPNWDINTDKYVIYCTHNNKLSKNTVWFNGRVMSFPTAEIRDEFFECFKDLLEKAKTLL